MPRIDLTDAELETIIDTLETALHFAAKEIDPEAVDAVYERLTAIQGEHSDSPSEADEIEGAEERRRQSKGTDLD